MTTTAHNACRPLEPTPLTTAIDRGVRFLHDSQLSYGELRSYVWHPGRANAAADFDSSPFPTAQVLYSLGFVDHPLVGEVVQRGLQFLVEEMDDLGLWRYWSRRNARRDGIPPDLDDTCCISALLEQHGVVVGPNRSIVLGNRNSRGRFYTWILPRPGGELCSAHRAAASRLQPFLSPRHPFWRSTEAAPDDVDAVVSANVLLYLGARMETRGAVARLIDLVAEHRETTSDKWYLDPCSVYYMLSRPYFHGVAALAPICRPMLRRLARQLRGDGGYGTALDTALAICTRLNLGRPPAASRAAVDHLLQAQQDGGGWPCAALYYGGPKRARAWGSEEITTALCLEALARFHVASEGPAGLPARTSR